MLSFGIKFISSEGATVDSFQKAINYNLTPSKIIVTAPNDAYHSEEPSAAMLSQMNSRYQTATVTSFLDGNALFKLYNAKRMLEEAKRFSQTQQELKDAVERERAVSVLNRMNLDLAKLSHSLGNKIMPAINDTTSEASTLNYAIKRAISAIISFSENVSRGLLADTKLKKDKVLKSNLIKLRQFLTNSLVFDETTAEMETEEKEDDMKSAEIVSAVASDLSSNIEEIYSRGVVESYSDRVANLAALIARNIGGAAAGGGGVEGAKFLISDILKTSLADVKNRASETDNLIRKSAQDTAQQQNQAVKQLEQRLDEREKQAQQLNIE